MDEENEKKLRQGRIMLWVSIAGSFVFLATMRSGSPGLGIVGLSASFLGALGGISNVARATEGSRLVMLLSMVVGFMPVANILPAVYYLGRAASASKGADEPRIPTPRPRASARPAPAAPAPRPATANRAAPNEAVRKAGNHPILGAVASVKQASLDLGEHKPAEGARLRVRLAAPDGKPQPEAAEPVVRATGLFAVCYLVDRGEHYTWATVGEMAEAGLELDQLHKVGVANLVGQANGEKPGLRVLPQAEEFFGLVMGGQFEASLVLVDELWDATLREHVPNGPVVAIPSRDMCAFCDARSQKGVAALQRIVQRVTHESGTPRSQLVSERLLARRDGRWQPFVPEKPADLPPLEFRL